MKKILVLITAGLMLLSLVLGCSSPSGGSNVPATSSASAPPASTSSTSVTPAGGKTDLLFWHMEEPPHRVKRFNELFDQFRADHPDINLTVQLQTWGDAFTKFPAAIMAGNGPDLLATTPDHCTVIYALGKVQPVTDIVEKISAQQKYFAAAADPYKYGDDIYAIPSYGMVQVLWYRKDIFAAAGLEAPKTWDDMLAAAEKLTTGDTYGIALPASLSIATDQVIYTLMAANGARKLIDGENKVTFNTPETVAAYEFYAKLMKYSPPDSTTYQWGEPQAMFNSAKAAMAIEKGQYLAPWTAESGLSPDDLGCVLVPTPTGSNHTSFFTPNAFMLLTDDPAKREATATFCEWLLSPEPYGSFLNAEPGLFVPLTETGGKADSFLNDPVIKQYPSQVATLLDATQNGCLFGFTDGISMKIGKITGPNLLAQTLQQIISKGMSPADAVAWGQAEMEKAVNS